MLRYFNFDPSFKLRWCLARDLFGTQILVTTGESAKSRELRSNVGCVGASVRGANFYVGCVGYLGQNIFVWVSIFLRGS